MKAAGLANGYLSTEKSFQQACISGFFWIQVASWPKTPWGKRAHHLAAGGSFTQALHGCFPRAEQGGGEGRAGEHQGGRHCPPTAKHLT